AWHHIVSCFCEMILTQKSPIGNTASLQATHIAARSIRLISVPSPSVVELAATCKRLRTSLLLAIPNGTC
ncbi:MAG: hypothetical protein RDV41_08440, partial [Planctomycetota bacterium]|nr:hypothetical protein [Planctomycetota bacterium]